MFVSPAILEKHGCTSSKWKLLFTAPPDKKERKIKKLELLLQNRINDGRLMNIQQYRTFAALDMAYSVPFAQTTPTIIQSLMGRKWENQEELLAELGKWGLKPEEMFLKTTTNGVPGYTLNVPTFYRVFVPLVKAYVTIRLAKLFNDRNNNPLLPYRPMQPSDEHRVQCEILTYLGQVMSSEYGYSNVLRDVIFQSLHYSTCLTFPREVWHTEYQEEGNKDVLQKEGIRYDIPHPTRMFYDLHHPISSFNTDTGCEWAGYWKIVTYGSILDNPEYWNRRNIGYTGRNWMDPAVSANFFQEVYPCQLAWPVNPAWGQTINRETAAAFYATNQRDMAVFQSILYMKLNPRQWKLGSYKHDIWIRFIVASDSTVIYAEPCSYNPVLYSGYDSSSLFDRNASMSLEVLPFQDIVGNTLSQIILTTKQNLANVNFYDFNTLNKEDIDKVQNSGEMLFRALNFIGFDSRKMNIAGVDMQKAIHQVKFQYQDVSAMFQTLNSVLAMLERLLQLSAQEAGSAASHQQSKAEIDMIGSSTSNRVMFTGSFVDDFMGGWKKQLYHAQLAYRDDAVEAMVTADIPNVEQILAKMGFKIINHLTDSNKLIVRGPKKSLNVESFLAETKQADVNPDPQTAQTMMTAVTTIAGNEALLEAVGPRTVLKLMEKAMLLAGVDKDFKLNPDQRQEMSRLQQMAQQIQIAAAKQVEETVAKPAAEQISKIQQEISQLDAAVGKIIQMLGLQPQPNAPQPAPTAPNPGAAPAAAPVMGAP